MTFGMGALCFSCAHFRSYLETGREESSCAAFPDGIPDEIVFGGYDHRLPYPGDHGVRYESNGDPVPEWCLTTELPAEPAARTVSR